MGTLIIDKLADFSASAIGDVGLYTSVSSGLVALHETRRNARKTINNSAPGGAPGGIVGAPTYSANDLLVSVGNGPLYAVAPTSGNQTFAFILKVENNGSADDTIANANQDFLHQGKVSICNYNARVQIEAAAWPVGTVPPLTSTGITSLSAYLDMSTTPRYDLFVAVLESNVSIRMYNPRTGANHVVSAVGYDFVFDGAPRFAGYPKPSGTMTRNTCMFAKWTRVLTPTEITTFYAEMQKQFTPLGIAI